MCNLQQQLLYLLEEVQSNNIDIKSIKCIQQFYKRHPEIIHHKYGRSFIKIFLTIAASFAIITYIYYNKLYSEECMAVMPHQLQLAFRPPENCNFCENIEHIERVKDITSKIFTEKYAYTGRPVIVEDATQNWTALKLFNYWYFRDVYNKAIYKKDILNCQFLPYKTGFRSIFEALNMPAERVEYYNRSDIEKEQIVRQEPWYFGWSNCNAETAEEFRKHYTKPYFLPELSENNVVDWFFMGTEGLGAEMHVDNVHLPSWQAQLSGRKHWTLAPPPECYFHCKSMEAIVQSGDIIVVDTNKWYHQTSALPGEISLSIGAEYD